MSRRGTHHTNAARAVRTLQHAEPGRSYQQLLARVRSANPPPTGMCVRCGAPLIADSIGVWYALDDRLAFCDEFLAHDELDQLLGGFSPAHQVDEEDARHEDERYAVHVRASPVDCLQCSSAASTAEQLPSSAVVQLATHLVESGDRDWSTLDPSVREAILASVRQAWASTEGAGHYRHGAARVAVQRYLAADLRERCESFKDPSGGAEMLP